MYRIVPVRVVWLVSRLRLRRRGREKEERGWEVNGPPSQLVGVELVLCQCVQEVAGLSRWVGNQQQSPVKIQGAAAQGAPA